MRYSFTMVVNTSRMMTDGHRDNSVGERKLIWDEENRLLSVDDNGFVSNYWYDADGERTVKTSGESDQVYVNGVFSGGSTNTAKFLVVRQSLSCRQSGWPLHQAYLRRFAANRVKGWRFRLIRLRPAPHRITRVITLIM